jgi:hypothetical protein
MDLSPMVNSTVCKPTGESSGIAVYFADPHSPWQRATKENTNGLLRQYFPKSTDLSPWSPQDVQAVATTLNARPARPSATRHPPRHSTSTYSPSNNPVIGQCSGGGAVADRS